MDHIIESKEYRNTLSDYGRRDMELFVDSEHYYDARDLVERIDDNNNLNCLKCFNFSRKEVWISEFGIKDHIGFSCILDSQTGTGAMYRFAGGSKNVTTCRCDEI